MRSRKFLLSIAGALMALALSASVASAAPGHIYGGAFTAGQSGSQVFTVPNSAHTSTLNVTCTTVSSSGTVTSPPVSALAFIPTFGGCTTNIGGTRGATVSSPNAWNAYIGTFNTSTGASTGNSSYVGGPVVIRPTGLTCAVTIASQTITSGVTGQNTLNGTSVASWTSPNVNGGNITASAAPAGYVSGCAGVAANDTGTYTGVIKVTGAWAGP
jgi:hypothetical protein